MRVSRIRIPIIIVLFSILGIGLLVKIWTFGRDIKDWKAVCVHGQVVFRANFAAKAMSVITKTPDGNPVACATDSFRWKIVDNKIVIN